MHAGHLSGTPKHRRQLGLKVTIRYLAGYSFVLIMGCVTCQSSGHKCCNKPGDFIVYVTLLHLSHMGIWMELYVNNVQGSFGIDRWCFCRKIAHRWLSLGLIGNDSALVQVMAWCRQATCHTIWTSVEFALYPHMVSLSQNGLIDAIKY